jgi:protocatechuate 3,4-dioxygenase alpha subunit
MDTAAMEPRLRIVGTVLDGGGAIVPDAVLEAWQGRDFQRVATGEDGRFTFTMTHPSAVPNDGMGAPHIEVMLCARGLLNQLFTRIYLPGMAPDTDPVMQRVPPERRATLVARPEPGTTEGSWRAYRFDVVLQGPGETVFFDFR